MDFNITVDDVSLTELAFSPRYSAAVEAKQVAPQEAQRASFLVERAKQKRQKRIVQRKEEAASKLLGEAMKSDPGFLKLRKIRAARTVARIVSESNSNKVYLKAASLMLNIADADAESERRETTTIIVATCAILNSCSLLQIVTMSLMKHCCSETVSMFMQLV